jgi:SAM-dependent methyltransferase
MMTRSELIEQWKSEQRQPFSGWDFSYLAERMKEDPTPWDYMQRAGELLDGATAALDMDTGGGERLLELRPHWSKRMAACENYPPNLKLARERLEPLGVEVRDVSLTRVGAMPYADGEFDLLLNRHSTFNSAEVRRILAPSGRFLTQQIDGNWAYDLIAVFGGTPPWEDDTLENCVAWLKAAGLEIVMAQAFYGRLSFTDVGAIVYYLRAVPWLVEGFSVETHLEGLLALQARFERGEGLNFRAGKFFIEAKKE